MDGTHADQITSVMAVDECESSSMCDHSGSLCTCCLQKGGKTAMGDVLVSDHIPKVKVHPLPP